MISTTRCTEPGCVFPPNGNGLCTQHEWKDKRSPIIPGLSINTSLGNVTPRSTGVTVEARPAEQKNWRSFEPKITIGESKINLGVMVYLQHMPGGKVETYGNIEVMAFSVSRDRYVGELKRRFNLTVNPESIEAPAVPQKETPEIPVIRAHGTGSKTQAERVLEAIGAGSTTAAECAKVTGMPANSCSAVLSALKSRGAIHKTGTDPNTNVAKWALGCGIQPPPAVVAEPIAVPARRMMPIEITFPDQPSPPVKESPAPADPVDAVWGCVTRRLALKLRVEEEKLLGISIRLVDAPTRQEVWSELRDSAAMVKKLRSATTIIAEISVDFPGLFANT